jgi:hypothetical protein
VPSSHHPFFRPACVDQRRAPSRSHLSSPFKLLLRHHRQIALVSALVRHHRPLSLGSSMPSSIVASPLTQPPHRTSFLLPFLLPFTLISLGHHTHRRRVVAVAAFPIARAPRSASMAFPVVVLVRPRPRCDDACQYSLPPPLPLGCAFLFSFLFSGPPPNRRNPALFL